MISVYIIYFNIYDLSAYNLLQFLRPQIVGRTLTMAKQILDIMPSNIFQIKYT